MPAPGAAAAEDPAEVESDSDDDQAIQDALVTNEVLDRMAGMNLGSSSSHPKAESATGAKAKEAEVVEEEEEVDVTQIGQIAPLPAGSEMVLQEKTDLYLHDMATGTFIRQSDQATVTLWSVSGDAEFTTWFTVFGPFGETGDVLWISSPLKPDMSIYFREVRQGSLLNASSSDMKPSPQGPKLHGVHPLPAR